MHFKWKTFSFVSNIIFLCFCFSVYFFPCSLLPSLCSFALSVKPIQALATLEMGGPIFGKVFQQTHNMPGRENDATENNFRGKKLAGSVFCNEWFHRRREDNMWRGKGTENSGDLILATMATAFTHPAVPYHPYFCWGGPGLFPGCTAVCRTSLSCHLVEFSTLSPGSWCSWVLQNMLSCTKSLHLNKFLFKLYDLYVHQK